MLIPSGCRGTIATILLFVVTGCDSGEASLALVRGKVSYRGLPLRCGTIVFTPDAARGSNGPLARAEIQPDGTYDLRTGDRLGAMPGWHRVTVIAVEVPAAAVGQRFPVPRSLVPEKYRDPELSGLACEVKSDRVNTIGFNLE